MWQFYWKIWNMRKINFKVYIKIANDVHYEPANFPFKIPCIVGSAKMKYVTILLEDLKNYTIHYTQICTFFIFTEPVIQGTSYYDSIYLFHTGSIHHWLYPWWFLENFNLHDWLSIFFQKTKLAPCNPCSKMQLSSHIAQFHERIRRPII
jgi:hypothetical protein